MTSGSREARIAVADAPNEGAVRIVEVGGHRVGIYRVAGELHALADRCPHRGARLCSGRIATPVELGADEVTVGAANSIVRCPWHKWEFEIATGRSLVDPRLRVRRYAVRVEGDDVIVTLDQPS